MKKIIILIFILSSMLGYSQLSNKYDLIESFTIKGNINDSITGESLTGVIVEIIGTDEKVYTDLDGNYEISVSKDNYKLKISYISYTDKIIELNKMNKNIINIELN